MYSKYLDYSEAAVKAHHAAQAESDQKDILIAHLKSDVYELRQLEGDFLRLDELIMGLEEKYSLLLGEKERGEKEQRVKMVIDKNSIIDLKEEIEALRTQLQKANIEIEELMRENTGMKRMADARAAEIQSVRYENKGLENKNDRAHQENKDIATSIKALKEERKKLEDQCEDLDSLLDANIAKLKGLEKQVRNSESTNARLDKTLHQAEGDNIKLVAELKQKNEEAKRAENRLGGLRNNIEELKITHSNLLQQAERNKADAGNHAGNLANEVAKGKELSNRLAGVEANIRAQEVELDNIMAEEEKLRKEHFVGIDRNKQVNAELDKVLALIHEYEQVNRELLDELEMYIDQDEQARAMLNRRDQMRELIESSLRKIAVSGDPIKHLKY